ncbi:MAG: aminotransferase class I/II-fold pyridoxal phosphate-dependent enzyme [Myxococcales bacterium]
MANTEVRAPAHLVDTIQDSVRKGVEAGVLLQRATDPVYNGRLVDIEGHHLCNFGGCSYLGLDQREELREGAIDATRHFGTQFSFSRAYIESPLYHELEAELEELTERFVLVTPSTSLGHLATLPTLITPRDSVIVDRSAHASIHMALAVLKGIRIEALPHNDMRAVEAAIKRLGAESERVWYVLDGLYSMFGDFAPYKALHGLLEKYPQLSLYVDDAHSTSWCGKHGRGSALESLPDSGRMIVALSLNKAFSAAGGAIAYPNAEMRRQVRECGGPMLFSGPVQPPMLGAALASAKLHMEPGFDDLQQRLMERIDLVNTLCDDAGIPLVNHERSPIFFVRCGPVEDTFRLLHGLREEGFFACAGMYPAVPHGKSGPRFTVSTHNTIDDIHAFVEAVAYVAHESGVSFQPIH